MQKSVLLLVISIFFLVTFTDCKKDPEPSDCYYIPTSKNISADKDLVGKKVEVEWSTSDGLGGSYVSKISQYMVLKTGTNLLTLNGAVDNSNGVGYFLDATQPLVSIIVKNDGVNISFFALKPFIYGTQGSSVWNPSSSAPIGVEETADDITISSNGMDAPSDENVWMCMKIVIEK